MRIVITGGAGFLGSHLCDALIQAGHTVVGYDRDYAAVTKDGGTIVGRVERVPGWQAVHVDNRAGTVKVPVRHFTVWQVVGGLVWVVGVTLAGYALGTRIPSIDRYLLPIIAVIVALSLLPVLAEVWRSRRPSEHSSRPDASASNPIPSEEGRQ